MARSIGRTLAIVLIIAAALVIAGIGLILNVAHVIGRISPVGDGNRTWYLTPEGWRWEGGVMVAMGGLLIALLMILSSYPAVRAIGIGMMACGLVAVLALIVYGTIQFTRHRRS